MPTKTNNGALGEIKTKTTKKFTPAPFSETAVILMSDNTYVLITATLKNQISLSMQIVKAEVGISFNEKKSKLIQIHNELDSAQKRKNALYKFKKLQKIVFNFILTFEDEITVFSDFHKLNLPKTYYGSASTLFIKDNFKYFFRISDCEDSLSFGFNKKDYHYKNIFIELDKILEKLTNHFEAEFKNYNKTAYKRTLNQVVNLLTV